MNNSKNPMGELALIFAICLLGEGVSMWIPFPPSVISMILLAIFLGLKWVKEEQIAQTSDFLMAHMGIFYVPACIGIMDYTHVILPQLVPFFIITGLTTPIVYLVTAHTVQFMMKFKNKEEKKDDIS